MVGGLIVRRELVPKRLGQLSKLDSSIKTLQEAQTQIKKFDTHEENLRRLRKDLAREEYFGAKTIYLIDFSVVRRFLNPLESMDPASLKSAFFLSNSPRKMFLSAGALYELF
jgi:hypothetical protein